MKRIIDFEVQDNRIVNKPWNIVTVAFEWDGKTDIIQSAYQALRDQMGDKKVPDDYQVVYWYWIK